MIRKFGNALLIVGGFLCVALAVLGIFIPILPTTPFLLLAAFLFARSSERFLQWLLNNRYFGTYIRNYHEGRGMRAREKAFTLTMLWLTIFLSTVFVVENLWVRLVLFTVAIGVTTHLLRIRTYRPELEQQPESGTPEFE